MKKGNQIVATLFDANFDKAGTGSSNEYKNLCLNLMSADTEDEVIKLLEEAGYWNDETAWRNYGDYENNYNTIGNQMADPDAALVEKLVNAVDARLMNECLQANIDPQSSDAPGSIRDAVSRFFDDSVSRSKSTAGLIREWPTSKRTEVARGITLCATGHKPKQGYPCFTIADMGEGQEPSQMPNTFLSTTGSNKLRVAFVQGKFNMGGTGALNFCGENGLQLILSRRNPALSAKSEDDPDNGKWGFTIIRRESPSGSRRSSVFTYLAPVGTDQSPNNGRVMAFDADEMPIFPTRQEPYSKSSEYGTLLKLYEYRTTHRTHMFQRDGIQSELDVLLPELPLPIRLYECRDYGGKAGSFETTLTGLKVRLEDDKAGNVEQGFPSSSSIVVNNEEMAVTIFAFAKCKGETYRRGRTGIIFTINGQTHGYLTDSFFTRKKVGLSYLKKDLLVIVDCSRLSPKSIEDLIMNSRDRLRNKELRAQIEAELEEILKDHIGLRELKNRRRQEEIASKVDDSQPLEDILNNLIKDQPTLASLFLSGTRLSTPFKPPTVIGPDSPYEGRKYPSYFRFKDKDDGFVLQRACPINHRCRVRFDTDVVNDYFTRDIDQGEFRLYLVSDNSQSVVSGRSFNLYNGRATVTFQLPENCEIGDVLHCRTTVSDETSLEPFVNDFFITIDKRRESSSGPKPENDKFKAGIALPNITKVYESEWDSKVPPYNESTALRIVLADGDEVINTNGGEPSAVYDFFINMDNLYLKSEHKRKPDDAELVSSQFMFGMVLIGLGLIYDQQKQEAANAQDDEGAGNANDDGIEALVDATSRAIAPVLLPMLESLGNQLLPDES